MEKDGRLFYKIRVSRGWEKGYLSTRWYPPEGWSRKAIERELHKQAAAKRYLKNVFINSKTIYLINNVYKYTNYYPITKNIFMKTSHVRKAKSATAELYTENDSTDHSVQTTYAPKQPARPPPNPIASARCTNSCYRIRRAERFRSIWDYNFHREPL